MSPVVEEKAFTTSTVDNLDHDPSSTTSEGSFHGTGISLFQHITEDNPGEYQERPTKAGSSKLSNLPDEYTDVKFVHAFNKEPPVKDYSGVEENSIDVSGEIEKEER